LGTRQAEAGRTLKFCWRRYEELEKTLHVREKTVKWWPVAKWRREGQFTNSCIWLKPGLEKLLKVSHWVVKQVTKSSKSKDGE
jgi:hypothetical protein